MSSSLITQMKLNYNLLKLQHGHIEALEEIYHLMYPSIFRYSFSILRSYEEAEDVSQEVLLRIERYASKYEKGTNPRAWIYKITKNLVITEIKKQKREIPLEKDRMEFLINKDLVQPKADLSFVKDALNCLTEREIQVVTLHIYGGLKHYETAEVLNLSYEKVRSIYTYALRKVEKRLAGRYYEKDREKIKK